MALKFIKKQIFIPKNYVCKSDKSDNPKGNFEVNVKNSFSWKFRNEAWPV